MCGINWDFRIQLYKRDDYRCYRCGKEVRPGTRKKRKGYRLATLDHYIPRHAGGSSDADNLKTCCDKCNSKKGGKIPK